MIPKIIWQTYETPYESLSKDIKDFIESWINLYPDFEYRYMDSIQREKFVLDNFGEEWHNIFINLPFNIMRADLWRHMILFIYGGIYFDLDTAPVYRLENWLKDEYSMIVFGDESDSELLFYFQVIASEAQNPITKSVLDFLLNQFRSDEYKNESPNNVGYVFKYSAELAFRSGIKKILDPQNSINLNTNHKMYNELELSKFYRFHCYAEEYDIFDGLAFENIDGANNWTTGYNSWWKEVGFNGIWRQSSGNYKK